MDINKSLPYLIPIISSTATFIIAWFLGRYLKGRGKIRCKISELRIIFNKHKDEYPHSISCIYEEAESGSYNIKLGFFNEKDVPTALTNPSIIFERKNKKKIVTAVKPENFHFNITEGFNLPSRELHHDGWFGDIKKESGKLENVLKSNKAFFVGYLPNGRKVKRLILKEPLWNRLDERSIEGIEIKNQF
jgi:hypothetical protein